MQKKIGKHSPAILAWIVLSTLRKTLRVRTLKKNRRAKYLRQYLEVLAQQSTENLSQEDVEKIIALLATISQQRLNRLLQLIKRYPYKRLLWVLGLWLVIELGIWWRKINRGEQDDYSPLAYFLASVSQLWFVSSLVALQIIWCFLTLVFTYVRLMVLKAFFILKKKVYC